MKLVTSLSPNRTKHQQSCIASWHATGCDVVAVQSPGESERLRNDYPDVNFVETDLVGDVFNAPRLVRIAAMLQQASEDAPVLIMNSDLKIVSSPEFNAFWGKSEPLELKVGIRYDRNITTKATTMFKWGIDVFRITSEIAAALPDIGMTLGMPAWDYWIPWHLVKECGYRVTTNMSLGMQFVHDMHRKGWSEDQYRIGLKLFESKYGVSAKDLTAWVQEITGRTELGRKQRVQRPQRRGYPRQVRTIRKEEGK